MGIRDVKKIVLFLIICSNFQAKLLPMVQSSVDVGNVANVWLYKGITECNNYYVRVALTNNADVNLRYEFGKTILHLAIDCINPDRREIAIQNIELLLNKKDIDILALDDNNRNVFHCAAIKNETEIVKMVIKKLKEQEEGEYKLKLALNSLDLEKGRTSLHYAVVSGNLELTQEMLLSGANLRVKDSKRFSVAYYIRNTKDVKNKNLFLTLVQACCR